MLKIAICEDNSIHCKQIHDLTCSCLQAAYDVDIYTSADDFLARITDQKCPYQIVLMDIELDSGDMSGIHLAEKINLSNSGTQIIFISQYLQYASAVYETNHVYFVSNSRWKSIFPGRSRLPVASCPSFTGSIFVSVIFPGITAFPVPIYCIWNANCEIPKYIQNLRFTIVATKFRILSNNYSLISASVTKASRSI